MDRRRFVATIGGALAAPLTCAQRPVRMVRIGALAQVSTLRQPIWEPFFKSMVARGWREGIEYELDIREAFGDPNRALDLAKQLVGANVDLILALSTANAVAARKASSLIPTVTWCGYPVEAGIAASLARPAGNVTGVANYAGAEIWGKYIQLLRELKPNLRRLGILWDYAAPAFPDAHVAIPIIKNSAKLMGIQEQTWNIRDERDLDEALAGIERTRVEAIVITNGGGIHLQPTIAKRIRLSFERLKLPAIVDIASQNVFQDAGCVLAYSPNVPDVLGRLAHFVDRILHGANPGELPFEQPSKFDLALNTKSAQAIGLAIPPSIRLRADRVIE